MTDHPVTVEDAGPMLRAAVRLPNCSKERALQAFTDPALVARWWTGELNTNLAKGGPYDVRFTRLDRTMTGEVVGYEPATSLEFTWNWDHEPVTIRRTVLVTVTALDEDQDNAEHTMLNVMHGPYRDGEAEEAARTEHREGWAYFLPRLAALLSA